jgi:hypothetical protein
MTDEITELDVVYIGRRQSNKNALVGLFVRYPHMQTCIEEQWSHDAIERYASIFKCTGYPHVIGGVYKTKGQIGGDERIARMVPKGFVYSSKINASEALVQFWETADAVAGSLQRTAAVERKLAKDTNLTATLAKLKMTYRKLTPVEKIAFQVMVLKFLEWK